MFRVKSEYYVFIILIYLFVFQLAAMQYFEVFKYWDELYAALAIPLYLMNFNPIIKVNNIRFKLFLFGSIFVFIGLIGNFVYEYQVFVAVISDVFLNIKFILGILTTYYLFKNQKIFSYKRGISRHVHIIIVVLFALLVYDEIYNVFPTTEIRYGLRSEMLFFGHPTRLASVSFFLILLNVLFSREDGKDFKYTMMASLIVVSTLRAKAIGVVILFVLMDLFIIVLKKKINLRYILLFLPIVICVAWDQIYFYFFGENSEGMARGALTFASLEIAKDCFPFGTGFGTFASAPSGEYYSKVYSIYGIGDIWGLSFEHPEFVSDTFWPMILGQTGFLGLILYAYFIFLLFREVQKIFPLDKKAYLSGLGVLIYLLISSVAESAFVNPLALPLSIILGLCFMTNEKESKIRSG